MNRHGLNFMGQALAAGGRAQRLGTGRRHQPSLRHGPHGQRSEDLVVNGDCRSWDIPNLWVCDGSVFPTTGGVNPSLTIQAIALRTADRIKAMARSGYHRDV